MFRKYAAHFDTLINILSATHERKVPKGSFIKYVRSDFVILQLPFLTMCAHALLAYTPSPLVLAYVHHFFKRNMAKIYFANFYQSKHRKQRYKIKKLLYKGIKKFQIKTPKRGMGLRVRLLTLRKRWEKSPGIEGAPFNDTEEMGMVNFGRLNGLHSLFHFNFVTNLPKKLWRTYDYSLTSISPPKRASTVLAVRV